jgi:hypothetical protein
MAAGALDGVQFCLLTIDRSMAPAARRSRSRHLVRNLSIELHGPESEAALDRTLAPTRIGTRHAAKN